MLIPSRITHVHKTKKHAILVIFLSVGMIEFNHLSNEKVHVTSEQNYAGS